VVPVYRTADQEKEAEFMKGKKAQDIYARF
jgi:hypothetical protein